MADNTDLSPQFRIEKILLCLVYDKEDVSEPATEQASFVLVQDSGSRPQLFPLKIGQLKSDVPSGSTVTALFIPIGSERLPSSKKNGQPESTTDSDSFEREKVFKGSSYVVA